MAARDYIKANKAGRTEIWICSDHPRERLERRQRPLAGAARRVPASSRRACGSTCWPIPRRPRATSSVRVTDVRRQQDRRRGRAAGLAQADAAGRRRGARTRCPCSFEIDGARSEVTRRAGRARGRAEGPPDPAREGQGAGLGPGVDPGRLQPGGQRLLVRLRAAGAAAGDRRRRGRAGGPAARAGRVDLAGSRVGQVHGRGRWRRTSSPGVDWDQVALLLWQAPLPDKDAAAAVRAFVERGGSAIFFPPRPGGRQRALRRPLDGLAGAQGRTRRSRAGGGDEDLLAHTQSGASLPVGQLQVRRACGLSGGEFDGAGDAQGGRAAAGPGRRPAGGGAYFCTTTPAVGDSSLATGGVVLYVLVQRALAAGAGSLGTTRQLAAGEPTRDDPARWERVAGGEEALSTEYACHRGRLRLRRAGCWR